MRGLSVLKGAVPIAVLWVLAGCSTVPAGDRLSAVRPPVPFAGRVRYEKSFCPVLKPALAKGYRFTGGQRPAQPGVYVCKRAARVPGGRVLAATGFYHQWVYTPAKERGVGFIGADYCHFAGLPDPIWNVFKPLAVVDHTGAVLQPDAMMKRMDDVDPARVEPLMGLRSTGQYFPFMNCQRWVHETLAAARRPHGAAGRGGAHTVTGLVDSPSR